MAQLGAVRVLENIADADSVHRVAWLGRPAFIVQVSTASGETRIAAGQVIEARVSPARSEPAAPAKE